MSVQWSVLNLCWSLLNLYWSVLNLCWSVLANSETMWWTCWICVWWTELWLKFYDLSCDVSSMSCCVIWAVCDQTCCTFVMKEDEIQCRFFVPFVMIRMYSMTKMDVFCDEKMLQCKTRGAKCDDVWSKIWWHVVRFEMIHEVGPVKDTWQTPHHRPAWQMTRHPLRGKSHVICQRIRCHVICHVAHATSPATSSASVSPQATSAPSMVHATWHFL